MPQLLLNLYGIQFLDILSEDISNAQRCNVFLSIPPESVSDDQSTSGVSTEGTELLLEVAEYMKVFVSAVEHPGHFWIQVLGSNSMEFDKMISEMTEYYSKDDNLQVNLRTFKKVVQYHFTNSKRFNSLLVGTVGCF